MNEILPSGYIYRRMDAGDLPVLKELYSKVFHVNPDLTLIRNKFDTSYTGHYTIGFFAFTTAGEAAAYYGVFPMRVSLQGKTMICGQSGDTMTVPEHQKKGLFIALAKMTYEACKKEGLSFIFGFPNSNSRPGFEKLGWEFRGDGLLRFYIPCYRNYPKIIFQKMAAWAGKNPLEKSFREALLPFEVSAKTALEKGARFSGENEIIRDDSYFSYKKFGGSFLISLGDFFFHIKGNSTPEVGLVNRFPNEMTEQAIHQLRKLGKEIGARIILFTLPELDTLAQQLTGKYPAEKGARLGFLPLANNLDLSLFQVRESDSDTF